MPLTDKEVRALRVKPAAFRCADGAGLYMLVKPTGAKLWRFDYRLGGKYRTLALGAYPAVSLKEAREARDTARKAVAAGTAPVPPSAAKRAAPVADTFEATAREWLALKAKAWAPSTLSKTTARLERDVLPWIGGRPLATITPPDLLTVARRIEARGTADTAHRALQDCGQVFRFGVATGRCDRDPTADLRGALAPIRKQHFAAVVEPSQVGDLLRTIEGFRGTHVVHCALRLAPLLFVRPGELRKMEWAEVDLERGEWNIPAVKMKMRRPHLVPLATQAVVILRDLHALTGAGRFAFPSLRGKDRPMSDAAVNAALRRLGIDTREEHTGHGFRAMARTVMHEHLGVSRDVIEHQLAHRVGDSLGDTYNRTQFIKERRAAMQRWADYLDQLRAGAKVLPFNAAA